MAEAGYCVFEYLYRDAGNYKAWGKLLLEGGLSDDDIKALCERFDSGEFFIAEQIGVPTLYQKLWDECGNEHSDELDHIWHEFHCIRPATQDDLKSLMPWGKAATLKATITGVPKWNEALSTNWPDPLKW